MTFTHGANLRRGNNTPRNNGAEGEGNNPNSAITISVTDLQVIQQRIADVEEAAHQNPCHRLRSESEPDYKRAPKRCNLKCKAPDKY